MAGQPALRELLQQARPNWSIENLDAVEARLAQVGIDSVEELAQALRQQLNERLRQAGLRTFTAETVRDFRQALAARSKLRTASDAPERPEPRATQRVAEPMLEPEPSPEPPPQTEREPREVQPRRWSSLLQPDDGRTSSPPEVEEQASVQAAVPFAPEPRRARQGWREALGDRARPAQEAKPEAPRLDHREERRGRDQEDLRPSEALAERHVCFHSQERRGVRDEQGEPGCRDGGAGGGGRSAEAVQVAPSRSGDGRPSWMKALQFARRADEGLGPSPLRPDEEEEPPRPDGEEVGRGLPKLAGDGAACGSRATSAVEEATGSTAATDDEQEVAESSGSEVIDLPEAKPPATAAGASSAPERPPAEPGRRAPAAADEPPGRAQPPAEPAKPFRPPASRRRAAAEEGEGAAEGLAEQGEEEEVKLLPGRPGAGRPFQSALSAIKEAERHGGGSSWSPAATAATTASSREGEATESKPAASEAAPESLFKEGQRFREKLRAARVAVEAAENGGSLFDEQEHDEGEVYMCAGCEHWPASSDPTDDGVGYCDNCWFRWEGGPLQPPPVPKRWQVFIVRTAKDQGLRLSRLPPLALKTARPRAGDVTVTLDPSKRYQTFLGFGGAFTESSAKIFQKLGKENQDRIIKSYFREDGGLAYTWGRLHMTSCDFSDGNWSCCDEPYDHHLKTFSVERFQEAIFPMVRKAQDAAGKPLQLLASPWSPPAWMKASGKMCKQGDSLAPEYLDTWARYFVRFAEELQEQKLPLWGFTVQNEPDNKEAAWETCAYSAEEERDFVRFYLGPALERAGFENPPRIVVWDHNRDQMVKRARAIYEEPTAASYVWGMGFHWYEGPKEYKNVQYVHDMYPDKHLIFTEGCMEGGPCLADWRLGEFYGANILRDLNSWTEAWIDWNLVLDVRGGPNHVGNYCSAPVIANTKNDWLLFQPSYYYIGHFSRHVKPGAVRISCVIGGPLNGYEDLSTTAFLNPDATIALVVLNMGDENVDFTICIGGSTARAAAPEHSITTFTLLDGIYPVPVVLGTQPDDATTEGKTYSIAGSWDDWKGVHEMLWDEDERCFHYDVQLTAKGWESFQILLGGHWKTILYPDEADGCHHSGSIICGPDDCGHGKNWTIGLHPLDKAKAGSRYKVRLFLGAEGKAQRVDWLPLG